MVSTGHESVNSCAGNASFKMKTFILSMFFAGAGFLAGMVVDYCHFYKDYEAACLFKDIINSSRDADGVFGIESRNHYDEWVQDFEALNFRSLKEEDLDKYSWGY